MADVHLHDGEGGFVETVELKDAPLANTVIERNGRIYTWDQRHAQFRQAAVLTAHAAVEMQKKDEAARTDV
jgi:hypothetical protein